MKEGRARLIWAANTANAMASRAQPTELAVRGPLSWNPWRWYAPRTVARPPENFRRFYAVGSEFSIARVALPAFLKRRGDAYLESGEFETRRYYPQLLRHYRLVHTRDWRVAAMAVRRNIPTIYEDHHESFNEAQAHYSDEIVRHPAFRLAVGISAYVAETMREKGVPDEKLHVEHSGLSEASLEPVSSEEIEAFRVRHLAGTGLRRIVAYTGGLHPIRGIELLLTTARHLTDTLFLVAGGRGRQVKEWKGRLQEEGLSNVRLIGYQPQSGLPRLLQSADALALPYQDSGTAPITSPLKFFEYLAAARPIAACRLPALEQFVGDPELAVEWCPIGDAGIFIQSVKKALQRAEAHPGPVTAHRTAAQSHTWYQRQERILARAGI